MPFIALQALALALVPSFRRSHSGTGNGGGGAARDRAARAISAGYRRQAPPERSDHFRSSIGGSRRTGRFHQAASHGRGWLVRLRDEHEAVATRSSRNTCATETGAAGRCSAATAANRPWTGRPWRRWLHRGHRAEAAFFGLDLPHSDACHVALPAAVAAAWWKAHVHAFVFVGTVSRSIIYDNDRCLVWKTLINGKRARHACMCLPQIECALPELGLKGANHSDDFAGRAEAKK